MKVTFSVEELNKLLEDLDKRCIRCCMRNNGRPWKQDCGVCHAQDEVEAYVMNWQKEEYEKE